MEWLHFYCTRWCTFHIRKVLELPNSPQDPIIIDLGEKARGKYHHQLLLEGIANSSCSRQCAKKVIDSRISIPHLHMHVWPIQIKGAPN